MIQSWNKVSESSERIGWRKMLQRVFLMPDGREEEFVVKDEGKPVCVLALTTDSEVILARQFRPGPEKVLDELPGGMQEKGESAIDAVKRELLEETGYTGDVQFVGTHFTCAYSNRERQSFVATNCKKVSELTLDENEFIEVVLMSLPEFREHLRSGQLTDVQTGYMGLDYLDLL